MIKNDILNEYNDNYDKKAFLTGWLRNTMYMVFRKYSVYFPRIMLHWAGIGYTKKMSLADMICSPTCARGWVAVWIGNNHNFSWITCIITGVPYFRWLKGIEKKLCFLNRCPSHIPCLISTYKSKQLIGQRFLDTL